MRTYRAATALLISTIIGVTTMTMPESLQQSLPGQISQQKTDDANVRIGVVTEIAESDNITVRISGSAVLVTASYLFPQYQPVLGDRVYVIKQDAQWMVLGTMSGPINSAIANPSFELGTLGALPTGWTLNVISSLGGPPTFVSIANINSVISGNRAADFGVDATVAGLSTAEVLSPSTPATPGSRWTAAYFLVGVNFFGSIDATLTVGIEFLDTAGASISITDFDNLYVSGGSYGPIYRRPNIAGPSFTAPAGTVAVRLNLLGDFSMNNPLGFISFYLDYMILRQL